MIFDRIHTWLGKNAPELLEGLAPPATEEQIRAAEQAMSVTLPEEVKAAYRIHNGELPDEYGGAVALLYGWEWLSLEGMVSEWQLMKGLVDEGAFADARSRPAGPIRDEWWHPKWLAVAVNGGGDSRCIDLAPRRGGRVGQVISWWHDDAHREVRAKSFAGWLDRLADELERGRYSTSPDYTGLVSIDDI